MIPAENNKKRPIYLNLLRIRLPITGVVSILHRLSGLILVLLLPGLFYLLQLSLESEAGFSQMRDLLASAPARLALLVLAWVMAQHFVSGLRHLLMDIDIGLSRHASRRSAWWTMVVSVALTAWVGVGLL